MPLSDSLQKSNTAPRYVPGYIGTKTVRACPCTLHNHLMNKGMPSGIMPPDEDGYHISYPDGYQSWSPKEVFEKSYRKYEDLPEDISDQQANLNFGDALFFMKLGKRVARKGWNGWNSKGVYLFLLPEADVPVDAIRTEPLKSIAEANGGSVHCLASIRMKTADGSVLTGWLASQTDMLAEDWMVL